jgi:hypothetical protein
MCRFCGVMVAVADSDRARPVLVEASSVSRAQCAVVHTPERCHAVKANRGLA